MMMQHWPDLDSDSSVNWPKLVLTPAADQRATLLLSPADVARPCWVTQSHTHLHSW